MDAGKAGGLAAEAAPSLPELSVSLSHPELHAVARDPYGATTETSEATVTGGSGCYRYSWRLAKDSQGFAPTLSLTGPRQGFRKQHTLTAETWRIGASLLVTDEVTGQRGTATVLVTVESKPRRGRPFHSVWTYS